MDSGVTPTAKTAVRASYSASSHVLHGNGLRAGTSVTPTVVAIVVVAAAMRSESESNRNSTTEGVPAAAFDGDDGRDVWLFFGGVKKGAAASARASTSCLRVVVVVAFVAIGGRGGRIDLRTSTVRPVGHRVALGRRPPDTRASTSPSWGATASTVAPDGAVEIAFPCCSRRRRTCRRRPLENSRRPTSATSNGHVPLTLPAADAGRSFALWETGGRGKDIHSYVSTRHTDSMSSSGTTLLSCEGECSKGGDGKM